MKLGDLGIGWLGGCRQPPVRRRHSLSVREEQPVKNTPASSSAKAIIR